MGFRYWPSARIHNLARDLPRGHHLDSKILDALSSRDRDEFPRPGETALLINRWKVFLAVARDCPVSGRRRNLVENELASGTRSCGEGSDAIVNDAG
jgi:hypothetical protein